MAPRAALVAGLLVAAEAQASGNPNGFLSDYNKFIIPSLNHMKHGNGAENRKDLDTPKIADRQEKQAAQKLLANESNNSVSLFAIGIGLLSLGTMLGVRLQRWLQPATVHVDSGGLATDMLMNSTSALGDRSPCKANSGRASWGHVPSQNLHPPSLCFATPSQLDPVTGTESAPVDLEMAVSGDATLYRRQWVPSLPSETSDMRPGVGFSVAQFNTLADGLSAMRDDLGGLTAPPVAFLDWSYRKDMPPERLPGARYPSDHIALFASLRLLPNPDEFTPVVFAIVPGVTKTDERITVVGASGYIGKAVVRECVRRGYETTAVTRPTSSLTFEGAEVSRAESIDLPQTTQCLKEAKTDVVICCLASRSGTEADSLKVDYEASVNCLEAARACGARHYVLLSAFCVAKPDLSFQVAKLKTEAALADQDDVTYSIVRPTAFFKSLSGQVEILRGGGPFVYFDLGGDRSATCNPISEADLAMAIVDCVADPARSSAGGEPIWNIGGPDAGISMKQQGALIADAIAAVDGGERKEPWLLPVPIGVFDGIVGAIKWVYDLTGADGVRDAWELGKIGRYYAVEDMLTTEPAEKYGSMSLLEHYKNVAENGQEYDPYTTVFAKNPLMK